MEMIEAMRKCAPGGYVARKAYPVRKYHKDESGVFVDAQKVDYIDFIAKDWEYYSSEAQNIHHSPLYWGREQKGCEKQVGGL